MARILIVEDEQHLADGLKFNMEIEGHEADLAESGETGIQMLASQPYDLVLLDVMLPGINGFEVVRVMRNQGNFVPVLMLTARSRPDDVLQGFEAGADDYLPKPFELAILLARLRGLLRRAEWSRATAAGDVFSFSGKVIDFSAQEIRHKDRSYPLTLMEVNFLRYLVKHQNKVVARKDLLEEVWGLREDTDTRAIDNFVVRLRRYIEDEPSKPEHLITIRGVGYRFVTLPMQGNGAG
jgi:DNA-binding response OmpR family regulator